MTDLDTPVILYTARELYEAQAVHDALEDQGIPSRVEGESLIGVLGDVPLGSNTAPRVMVREVDLPVAQAILDQLAEKFGQAQAAETNDQLCLACGAEMQGVDQCPKCGWSFVTDGSK